VWIYRYLRADMEEIDMGPYGSEAEAREAAEAHASFGAIVTPAIEVPDDYRLWKGVDE